MIRFASVLNLLSIVIVIIAVLMLIPYSISVYYQDGVSFAFLESFILTMVVGLLTWAITMRLSKGQEIQIREGFLLALLSWLVIPALSAIPLLLAIPGLSFTDAYFETMSGLTTTGATVLTGLDHLAVSINFWRTFLVWLGGMGVVVLAVALMPLLGVGGHQAFKAETPGPMKDEKITPRITQTAKGLWIVYSIITVACIVSLCLAGMPTMDSIMHTFSIMGLGGFSSHDDSFGFFKSPAMESVAIVFMLIAGVNFATHFVSFSKKSVKPYIADIEAHAFLILMVFSIILVSIVLWVHQFYDDYLTALRHAAFNVVSIATTTGLVTVDYNLWPIFAPIFMILLSCFATCAGSTGGGIKMIRAQLLLKKSQGEILRLIHPHAEIVVKHNNQPIQTKILYSISTFFFLYVVTIIFFTLLMLLSGCDVVTGVTAVVASINNMGPGLNLVGPATTFAVLTDFQTWVCTFSMLLGRLELFTFLVVLSPRFWD